MKNYYPMYFMVHGFLFFLFTFLFKLISDFKIFIYLTFQNLCLFGSHRHSTHYFLFLPYNLFIHWKKCRMLRSPNSTSQGRVWIIYAFIILVHFIIVGRFFKIQIIDNEKYSQRAKSNYVRALSLPAPRGLILDRNGKILLKKII